MLPPDRKAYDPGPGRFRVSWNPQALAMCKRRGCPLHAAHHCGRCFKDCRCAAK